MKRDLDLSRAILLKVENLEVDKVLKPNNIGLKGHDIQVIAEHVKLLEEAGFIDAEFRSSMQLPHNRDYTIRRLLNPGHDFLADTRNPSVWTKVKTAMQEKGGDFSFTVAKAVAAKFAATLVGL